MSDGQAATAWNHTAAVLAMLAEINRDREKRDEPFTPQEFHPHHRTPDDDAPRELTPEELERRNADMREIKRRWRKSTR